MHPPYNLRNGSPLLSLYAYLYHTTQKQEWTGTMQNLAAYVEIPLRTLQRCMHELNERNLVSIEHIAYSTYTIQALRLARPEDEPRQIDAQLGQIDETPRQIGATPRQIGATPRQIGATSRQIGATSRQIGALININNNINKNNINKEKTHIVCVKERAEPTHTQPPTWEELVVFADSKCISREVVVKFYSHYSSNGWRKTHGGKIYNWKAALCSYDINARERLQHITNHSHIDARNAEIAEQEKTRRRYEREHMFDEYEREKAADK